MRIDIRAFKYLLTGRLWTCLVRGLALILFLLLSCAKVGDPLPPLVKIPDPVAIQLVQQARDRIEILIPPPLHDIEEIEVYRECGIAFPAEFSGVLLTSFELGEIERNPHTGFFVVQDREPVFGEPCRYQIRVRNEQGRRSHPSAPPRQN